MSQPSNHLTLCQAHTRALFRKTLGNGTLRRPARLAIDASGNRGSIYRQVVCSYCARCQRTAMKNALTSPSTAVPFETQQVLQGKRSRTARLVWVDDKSRVPSRTNRSARRALGGVDSKDSVLGANQIQGCFWGGGLGCDGSFSFERRGVGTDGAADRRSSRPEGLDRA